MIRCLVTRTRIGPVVSLPAKYLATWSCRQKCQNSTVQESHSPYNNGGAAAILHGGKKARGNKHQSSLSQEKTPNAQVSLTQSSPKKTNPPASLADGQRAAEQERIIRGQQKWTGRGNQKKKEYNAAKRAQNRLNHEKGLKHEAHIRKNVYIPAPMDYPDAPQRIFTDPRTALPEIFAGLATIRSDCMEIATRVFRYTLRYESAARTVVVTGEGHSKKAAETTAFLHMLAKFHELGIMDEVIKRDSETNQLNRSAVERTKAEEKDGIMDIYNYAARFDAVPQITANKGLKKGLQKHRGRPKRFVKVTVELVEQAIKVTGEGTDLKSAENRAALEFKTAAERYHAELGSKSLVIRDSTALTIGNAPQFIEFFKIVRPGVSINTVTEEGKHTVGPIPKRMQTMINGEAVGEPVEIMDKKKAEATALLTACVAIKKRDPDLFPRFLRALEDGNGQILRPFPPLDMHVEADCSMLMRNILMNSRTAGLPDRVEDLDSPTLAREAPRGSFRQPLDATSIIAREEHIKDRLTDYLEDPALAELRNKRAQLPMNQYGAKVLDIVNNNMYSIIVGATGSGKTTQVPQIILEDAIAKGRGAGCNVICTQPRRIAAISVASRVAAERSEKLQDSVGYQVRFDAKYAQLGGSINYCTTGILLQQLQHSPDKVMDNTSHLVIDEVHERDMQIDFLLILLKKNVIRRKALGKSAPQVVLMSATMDTELFASYFKSDVTGGEAQNCPSLSVPGRTYPVREKYIDEILKDMSTAKMPMSAMHVDPNTREYLEVEDNFRKEARLQSSASPSSRPDADREDRSVIDWKRERKVTADGDTVVVNEQENAKIPFGLIATTIDHITRTTSEGAILVFLPGLQEIIRVEEQLTKSRSITNILNPEKYRLHKLHSSMPAGQTAVFDPPPQGCRKIILSTNIAETSVTIPDVQHVIDTGKLREKQYDQMRRITMLSCTWISKSNSKQRAGRAGRVQNGNYYALFSKERYDSMRNIGLPELLRADLQEICLDVKAQAFKAPIREFLADAIEPPSPSAVDTSVKNLQSLDALAENEEITPLGRLLAALPVHPTLGKMIVLGIIFRCLDPMLVLGAASAERALFLNPLDGRKASQESKLSFAKGSGSDHMALLNAVRDLRQKRDERGEYAIRDFASRNYLHANSFKTIDNTAKQIEDILVESGLIPYTPPSRRLNSQFGDPRLNENSHRVPLIKALALAGFHPNLAVNAGGRSFRTPGEKGVIPHPSSTNSPRESSEVSRIAYGTLYSYSTMVKSNDGRTIYLRDTTVSTPLMASLFGGRLKRNSERGNIIELDNWLPFYVISSDRRSVQTIVEFRKALERLLVIAFRELGTATRGRKFGERQAFLADEKVREIFAEGLVTVLDQDARADQVFQKIGQDGNSVQSSERPAGRMFGDAGSASRGGREDDAMGRGGGDRRKQ